MYEAFDSSNSVQVPWREFLLSLEAKPVIVPYADQLAENFPACRVRSRRDFPKLVEMIKTCAYLHQKQREQADGLILASEQDYYLIKPLFEHCYRFGPDFHTTTLLNAAVHLASEFTVADLQTKMRWGKSKTYDVLQRCSETGFVVDGRNRGHYRLVRTAKHTDLDLPEVLG